MADYYPRREVLLGTAWATAALAGCSNITGTTPATLVPAVIDQLQKAVAAVCPVIPAVTTLVAIAAASFPQVAGVATITQQLAQEIADTVCKLFDQTGATKGTLGGSYKVTLAGKEIPLNGFHIVNGKPEWF